MVPVPASLKFKRTEAVFIETLIDECDADKFVKMIDGRQVVPIDFPLDFLPVVLSFPIVREILFEELLERLLMLGKQLASQPLFNFRSMSLDEIPGEFLAVAESVVFLTAQSDHDLIADVACRRTTWVG